MINNVVLVGRITRDPEVRYTSSNIASVNFSLAVDRPFSGTNGERQADFINCVAWRQSAEFMAKYIKKGYMMGVTGRIQTRNYQGQDGQTHYVTEVVCDTVRSLQGRDQAEGYNDTPSYSQPTQSVRQDSRGNKPEEFDVSDVSEDDLPF